MASGCDGIGELCFTPEHGKAGEQGFTSGFGDVGELSCTPWFSHQAGELVLRSDRLYDETGELCFTSESIATSELCFTSGCAEPGKPCCTPGSGEPGGCRSMIRSAETKEL